MPTVASSLAREALKKDREPHEKNEVGSRRLSILDVAPVVLPSNAPRRRKPTRPVDLRGPDFEKKFDFDTLFYDSVVSEDGTRARIVAPPLFNLRADIAKATIRAGSTGAECRFEIRDLDRQSQILVDVPPDERTLTVESGLGSFPLRLNRPENHIFRDERVIFTLSKNNDLQWVMDWARFYRDVHGATAALIFDNGSTLYTAQELLDALRLVKGLRKVVVVRWPFRHGPPGHGLKRYWDSNFSQLGAFEVARWRFLQSARSVVNCDVDELVLSKTGASVFESAESSRSGVVSYYGDWVFGIEGETRIASPGEPMRFKDYRHVLRTIVKRRWGLLPTHPMRCKMKWTVVPRRCPPGSQWHVHTINGFWQARLNDANLRFRHFREISNSWKYDRNVRERLDRERHEPDRMMASAFGKVDWER